MKSLATLGLLLLTACAVHQQDPSPDAPRDRKRSPYGSAIQLAIQGGNADFTADDASGNGSGGSFDADGSTVGMRAELLANVDDAGHVNIGLTTGWRAGALDITRGQIAADELNYVQFVVAPTLVLVAAPDAVATPYVQGAIGFHSTAYEVGSNGFLAEDGDESGLHTEVGIGMRFRASSRVGIIVGGVWEYSDAPDHEGSLTSGNVVGGVRIAF